VRAGVVLSVEEIGKAQSIQERAESLAPGEVTTYIVAGKPPETMEAPGRVVAGISADLEGADSGQHLEALRSLLAEAPPEILLFLEGSFFESVGARLAGALGWTAVRGAVEVRADGSAVTLTKPAFGGKAELEIRLDGPAVVALAPGEPTGSFPARKPEVVEVGPLTPEWSGRRAVREASGEGLREARVIVSGGRGLGSREAYESLSELAGRLGAAMGASRAAVDEGWASPTRQVGLTGEKVSPDLYLAIGISGASQHLAGIGGAKKIVAVTKDEKAPILEAADVGVVADWHALWPELKKALVKDS